jgi:choline dehydrogenase-like flavoprotein
MIIDSRDLSSTEIRGSIAIIGAGAAGITLAIELTKHFKDVLLLESGGLDFEQETQNLYDGRVIGQGKTDVETSRLRYLGGTTNHWTGLCAPLDALDFERIEGRPYSGWPFKLDELVPFYVRAYPYCQIVGYQKTPSVLEGAKSTAQKIADSSEFQLAEFRQSPPTRFGEQYRPNLKSSDRIKLYLHANVTDISVSSNGKAISSLDVRTLNGRRFKVTARAFILCCGGIENPRILLNCTTFFPTGIGNTSDLVGRFFMDNPATPVGNIIPRDSNFDLGVMNCAPEGSSRVMVVFKNSAEISTQRGRRGASLFLFPVFSNTAEILKVRSSPSFEAIREIVQDIKRAHIPKDFANKSCIALRDPIAVAKGAYYRLIRPLRDKTHKTIAIFVRIETAQLPNPDSRVTLSNEVDALGMKRVILEWRISDGDRNNLYQTALAFARGVGASGFGRMALDIEPNVDLSKVSTTCHHLGTTRMHDDSRQGVVDQNCQVHGLDNLYIAGSSVFPTGIRVNPTLTIVALAIRLADHLKTKASGL